jgi:flagellar biosynthesis anti-sigma factor FlgM
MRIDPQIPGAVTSGTDAVSSRTGAAANTSSSAPTSGEPNDTVQLSANQTTLSRLVSHLATVPEIRQDKVASLRAEIQSGQFQRSNDQVAGAIVNEHLGSSNE